MASSGSDTLSSPPKVPGPSTEREDTPKTIAKQFEGLKYMQHPSTSKSPVKWLKAARKLTFDEETIPSKKDTSKEKFIDPRDQPSTSK